jgi:hypothetical protein
VTSAILGVEVVYSCVMFGLLLVVPVY